FDPPARFVIGAQNHFLIADLNGDGTPDVTGSILGGIYSLLNNCGTAATADLSVTNTAPASVANNSVLTYSITATNHGPDTATNVLITDVLPAGSIFRTASGSSECRELNGTVSCSLASLAPNDSAAVQIDVQLVAAGGRINQAGVTANETDPNPADNSAAATTIVGAGASTQVVSNGNDNGTGSLRQAIDNSNLNPGSTNTITFAIGNGPATVALVTRLPNITVPVVFDATTQPGFAGVPLVTLDGSGTAAGNGLTFTSSGSTVRGLAIRNFKGAGVTLAGDGNRIGGLNPGDANELSLNAGSGVFVTSGRTNTIRGNSIHDNGALGIDLAPGGSTPNDDGDADTGPNDYQNFPVLTQASVNGNLLTVSGTLNSTPNSLFQVDFYGNAACDSSSHGEGALLIGSRSVTTDATGNATFVASMQWSALIRVVTATATDAAGNTSEFSACAALPQVVTVTAADPSASEVGTDHGTFRFTRVGDLTFALNVTATFSGTASNGGDYTFLSAVVTFPAGQATVDRVVTPFNDGFVEGPETVIVSLVDGAQYDVGFPSSATITIADNPTPVITVTAVDANASEIGPDPGTFRFTRVGDPTFALSVTVTFAGTASNGGD